MMRLANCFGLKDSRKAQTISATGLVFSWVNFKGFLWGLYLSSWFKKLDPSAEEFVPLSRRFGGDIGQRLSVDVPMFVSPVIDNYAYLPIQQRRMHVLQLVSVGVGGAISGGRDSAATSPPTRRNGFNQGKRRMRGRLTVWSHHLWLLLWEGNTPCLLDAP